MTSPHYPSKKTEVPEVVGTFTLVITRPRAGEPRLSCDLREFISLNLPFWINKILLFVVYFVSCPLLWTSEETGMDWLRLGKIHL